MSLPIPMRFENAPLLWLVDNVYTKEEGDRFIEFIERSAPTLATNNRLYRDQDRVIKDDPEIAEALFRRLHLHLPQQIMHTLKLVGLNERLRIYRYRIKDVLCGEA